SRGAKGQPVGLVLSLSGKVTGGSLPSRKGGPWWLYKISLKGQEPNREFLRLPADLARFRRVYQNALAAIVNDHEGLKQLHLFPAVPAPIAISCGQDLLPKVHPALVIYDNVRGTFREAITINTD